MPVSSTKIFLDFRTTLKYIVNMEQEKNPAIVLKELIERLFPIELLIDGWDEVWQEVIDQLDQQIPYNDN